MKKSILLFVALFSIVSITLTSCSSDDDDSSSDPAVLKGTYEIYLDGTLYKKGTNADVGITKDDQGNYVNTITIGTGTEIAIVVSGFTLSIGADSDLGPNGDAEVVITSGQELYSTTSGVLTRTSASKISFDGECTKNFIGASYTITGFVESEAYEVIVK